MRYAKFHPLETTDLHLRALRMEDLREYNEGLFGNEQVARYMLFSPHKNLLQSQESLKRKIDRYAAGRNYCWGIALRETDELIGLIELVRLEEQENCASFVYMLSPAYWNRGYGTQALKAVFHFAFEELELRRISADHMTENPASGAVMRKAGMRHLGKVPGKYEKQGVRFDAQLYEIKKMN